MGLVEYSEESEGDLTAPFLKSSYRDPMVCWSHLLLETILLHERDGMGVS